MAYDAARQRLVMFGGCDAGGSPLADTWEYDGNHWVLVATAHSPAARWWHCAVYDDVRQRVVLFGGGDDVALFGDTWEYDGVDWSLTATAHSPPARWGASMVYDSDRRSAVLFGANGGLGDTWEYDGTDWRQVSTQWSPSGDSLISMAYDSTRRKTVLFGTGEQHDQTWEYDGTNWRQVTTPVSPMGRWAHAMAYHADRRRVVMFGGYGPSWPSGSALADTWEYDGSMWTQLSLSLFPAAREQHAMAYDSTRSVTVLFGGLASPGGVESDTWEFGPAGSPLPGVRRLEIRPNALYLQDGQITSTLHLHALDVYGSEVSVASHELRFRSLNPDVAEVSPHGVVTATGFGSAEITAMVDGNPAANQVRVQAGRFALRPAVLLLAASGPTTGTVVADVRNADGSILSRAGRTFSYFSTNPSVASVDSNGVVTALRPPRDFGETPYVTAVLEGVQSTNAALVRVTTDTLRLTMVPMEDRHVAFYLPQQAIQGFDYRAIFTTWDATRVTELAYQAMADLVGLRPFGGGIQFLVNDPGHGSDNTVPCGLTGNPVRLGTDIDRPVHNSCCIVAWGDGAPHFTVFFHETAHNFLDDNSRFGQFLRGSPNSNWAYSEGLASNVAARAALTLQTRQAEWIIPQRVLDYIMPIYHLLTTPDLDAYVANGARYEQLNPSVVYDLMLKGYQAAGPGFFRRFYAIFQPTYSALPGAPNSDREQATFFAAAVGAAANQDMRDRFKTQWGFPIVDAYYDTVYPQLLAAANQVW